MAALYGSRTLQVVCGRIIGLRSSVQSEASRVYVLAKGLKVRASSNNQHIASAGNVDSKIFDRIYLGIGE